MDGWTLCQGIQEYREKKEIQKLLLAALLEAVILAGYASQGREGETKVHAVKCDEHQPGTSTTHYHSCGI